MSAGVGRVNRAAQFDVHWRQAVEVRAQAIRNTIAFEATLGVSISPAYKCGPSAGLDLALLKLAFSGTVIRRLETIDCGGHHALVCCNSVALNATTTLWWTYE
ncbi:hypothetical protein NCCP2145_07180 [Pseudarthrobacter sp. NCCP-2145]|nr:hypothetical protein NCCP2145_07180 [Pseudarthrobacter sp. NCCP-2145]